ncbi:hypothetical protein Tco_0249557 [Tanacetum coccineum]
MLEGKIPSATSATDVAATWASGTQLADVALLRRLTRDPHADVAAEVAAYVAMGLGTRWQVRMAARKASWLARDTRTNKEASEMTRGGCWLVDADVKG